MELTSPAEGASFSAGDTVAVAATATARAGAIASFELLQGTTRLALLSSAPYRHDWTAVPAGSHTLVARAVDDQGHSAEDQVHVTVAASGGDAGQADGGARDGNPVSDGAGAEGLAADGATADGRDTTALGSGCACASRPKPSGNVIWLLAGGVLLVPTRRRARRR